MNAINDILLSRLTVRILNAGTSKAIGTGVLYSHEQLKDKVYILTAAHNLYTDGDGFSLPLNNIILDIYNENYDSYFSLAHSINYKLVSADTDKDVAVLVVEKKEIEQITGDVPSITAIKDRHSINTFVAKGFAQATQGKELVLIKPVWVQAMTEVQKFQLQLNEDYSYYAVGGFSGSGIFLESNERVYLYGLFTRYRPEENGRVVYCQYIHTVNEILEKNFLPLILFYYFADHGLTADFFKTHLEGAIQNLGPRFSEKLNFRLPIAKLFNYISKDNVFKRAVLSTIDRWLLPNGYAYYSTGNTHLKEIEDDYAALRGEVVKLIPQLNFNADHKINLDTVVQKINTINSKLFQKRDTLFDMRGEEEKKNAHVKKDHGYIAPYTSEIRKVRELTDNNDEFLSALDDINFKLSNFPVLIIQGDAGSGKSHLLGDIANEKKKRSVPIILLLGPLFKYGQTIWQNIIAQLNISCTKEQLLFSLNSIGKQTGSRLLILIDAINEGPGRELWYNDLAGFIQDLSVYPFIGLVVTIRSTYLNLVLPENIRNSKEITIVTHEGFKGSEYEALRLFCEHYGLEQPNFPILTPEFSNPLVLQLVCQGVQASEEKIFPHGFQGISKIFEYYLVAITTKLANKRDEYQLRPGLVKTAVLEMAKACYAQEHIRALSLEKSVDLFDQKFPQHKLLLSDLIHESVFIQSTTHDYESEKDTEVIYFSYERFGDFFNAEEMLKPFDSVEKIITAFTKNEPLGKLLQDAIWHNRGILEAMAVLLPEKFELELFEVFAWAFDSHEQNTIFNIDEWLNHYLIGSLKWRKPETINNDKITGWINGDNFNLRHDVVINAMIELSAIKEHPFNGDRLYRNFIKYSMAERDAFWQLFMRHHTGKDDHGRAFPLQRLLDWAWTRGISAKLESETARLSGLTLAWILSSTNRELRDQATKALVNLLENQSSALLDILKAFQNTDDSYILERLYGVAYGCILRTISINYIQSIAEYIYDATFNKRQPPPHILLRDYARGIIEYAVVKNIDVDIDLASVRPPYKSDMPVDIPSQTDIRKYEMDRKTKEFKENHGYYNNKIAHSVISWDFGRYTIDGALRDFDPINFRTKSLCDSFFQTLANTEKKLIKLYEKALKADFILKEKKQSFIAQLGQHSYEQMLEQSKVSLENPIGFLKTKLSPEKFEFFSEKMIGYLKSLYQNKERSSDRFDAEPYKRWIVKRVFELGYDSKIHGSYESSIESYSSRSGEKIERIGKKYQWIAFHEIVGMISDNHKIKDSWGNKTYKYFQGAWQEFLRDVDPAFTTRKIKQDDDDEMEIVSADKHWSVDKNYKYWNIPNSSWLQSLDDLPEPKHVIERKDPSGKEWLFLRANINWQEAKQIGKEKYNSKRKDLWYLIQGYLFYRKDRSKVISWFAGKDFKGRNMPESFKSGLSLFNRENYWSPAGQDNEKQQWRKFENSPFKIMVTTTEAVGELSQDDSGAHFSFDMPCKLLYEGMELKYGDDDGTFENKSGEIVIINNHLSGILIDKNFLLDFLREKKLEIIWAVLGEKRSIGGAGDSRGYTTLSGTAYFENDALLGSMRPSAKKKNDEDD